MMRFEGNSLMQEDAQVGRLIYKAQRWHWHAATPRPGRRPTGHARTRDKAKRELLAYVQCAARESRLAA